MPDTATYTLPSLIGGISEQSPQDRAPNAHEDQENHFNDPLNGCMARPGGVVVGTVNGYAMEAAYVHDIPRDSDEFYQIHVADGAVRIFNIVEGVECAVTDNTADLEDYLTHTGSASQSFGAVTVEDQTFLVNRQITVEMLPDLSPARPNLAMVYFRSAQYSTDYKVILRVNDINYSATYTTPDNSTSGNADYIATNRLAGEMVDALDALKASVSPSLAGFDFSQRGSTITITRSGTNADWTIDTADGQGDTQLIAIKEWAKKFEDLPQRATEDFVVGVRGVKREQADDYWLQRDGREVTGSWEEVVKPETPYLLDETTMPRVITNTAKNTFEIDYGSWGARISGDGVKSSPDPEMVGKKIRDISFISGRLCLLTLGSFQMSRTRNAFVFFPDTAQVRLDTDPVGFDVANGETTLMSHLVSASESLFMWGNQSQLRLDSGDAGRITEETVDAVKSTNYEFDGNVRPKALGLSSVVFGTEGLGTATRFMEVMYDQGQAAGEVDLNGQCTALITGGLKAFYMASVSGFMLASTFDNDIFYVYQWKNEGNKRVQSAWNKWTFPHVDQLVAAALIKGELFLSFEMAGVLVIEKFTINPKQLATRDIRLDHRVDETGATEDDGWWTVELPFAVPSEDRANYVAIENEDSPDGFYAGRQLEVEWIDGNTVRVLAYDSKFFFGAKIRAWTRLSEPFVQTQRGTLLADQMVLSELKVSHADTTYYRVEVRNRREELLHTGVFDARLSVPDVQATRMAKGTGSPKFKIGQRADQCWIDLINDTPYPSRWVQAQHHYTATM